MGFNISWAEEKYFRSVIVLNCGGTIDMKGERERKVANRVEGLLREKGRISEIDAIYGNVFPIALDSSNIGEIEWDMLFTRVQCIINWKDKIEKKLLKNGARLEKGGVVITHGTDTLHITSLVISLRYSQFTQLLPIIFTGSHSPAEATNSDAKKNLEKSIFAAKERFWEFESDSLPPNVYVLIGEDIHLASRLTKVYTRPNDDGKYFYSFPNPVGIITSTKITRGSSTKKSYRIKIDQDSLDTIMEHSNNTSNNYFNEIGHWGIVEHIVIDRFTPLQIIDSLARRISFYGSTVETAEKKVGVIIQGKFAKNNNFNDILDKFFNLAEKQEVIIFTGSKEIYEAIKTIREARKPNLNHKRFGLIHKSLSHSKARVKMSWLLKLDMSLDDVWDLMGKNIAGDIFETKILPEWIKYETFQPHEKHKEIVMIYPNIHKKVIEDAITRLISETESNNNRLYLYGFGDGHIPCTHEVLTEIAAKFVKRIPLMNIEFPESDLNAIVDSLSCIIIKEKVKIKDYLKPRYEVEQKWMKKVLKKEIANGLFTDELDKLSSTIKRISERYGERYLSDFNLEFKMDLWVELFVKKGIILTPKKAGLLDEKVEELDRGDAISILIDKFPHLIAKRLLKDAVMESNSTLAKIGTAIDNNIQVEVRTTAMKSKTDTSLYEIGTLLKVIGVHSQQTKGWNTSYLVRKKEFAF